MEQSPYREANSRLTTQGIPSPFIYLLAFFYKTTFRKLYLFTSSVVTGNGTPNKRGPFRESYVYH
jgi:hypothetical protein